MKRLILSEGKNDTLFLKELLTNKIGIDEKRILFLDQNTQDSMPDLKTIETRYFNQLDSDWLQFELLVKSESGKNKIIGVTCSQLINFCKKDYNPIILVDLDSKDIVTFLSDLKEKLISRFKSNNPKIEWAQSQQVSDALMYSIKLFFNDLTFIGKIYVIGFYKSLEEVTGIKNGIHNDTEKLIKLQNYIKQSNLHDLFNKALQNM